jgi:hypothetical protein
VCSSHGERGIAIHVILSRREQYIQSTSKQAIEEGLQPFSHSYAISSQEFAAIDSSALASNLQIGPVHFESDFIEYRHPLRHATEQDSDLPSSSHMSPAIDTEYWLGSPEKADLMCSQLKD